MYWNNTISCIFFSISSCLLSTVVLYILLYIYYYIIYYSKFKNNSLPIFSRVKLRNIQWLRNDGFVFVSGEHVEYIQWDITAHFNVGYCVVYHVYWFVNFNVWYCARACRTTKHWQGAVCRPRVVCKIHCNGGCTRPVRIIK